MRYLVSGGSAFAIEYSSFLALFYIFSIGAIMANAASFLMGLVTSFLLNKTWVFKGSHHKSTSTQLAMYVILALINLIITSIAIDYLIEVGAAAFLAKILLIIVVAGWNFIILKNFIFRATQ